MVGLTLEQLKSMGATPAISNSQPKSKGLTFDELQKMGAKPVMTSAPQEESKGLISNIGSGISNVFRGITEPVVTLGIARPIQAIKAIMGDEKQTAEDLAVNLPYYGKIEAPQTGKDLLKDVGRAAETVALGIGGGGAKTLVKGFAKPALGTLVKQGAKVGAISGGAFGAGSALESGGGVKEAIEKGATGALIGGGIGGAIPLAGAGISKTIGKVNEKLAEKSAQKLEQANLIKSGVPEAKIASKTLSETGRVIPDKIAKESIRQGIPEADVALIKNSSQTDKSKMLKMLDIRESQLTNKRVIDRATDVVGNTFTEKLAKPIEKLNKEAGKKLDMVAQRLAGKKVDPTGAVTQFASDLESSGITVTGKGLLNFKGSNFEGLKGAQQLITSVWNRAMRVAKTGDAMQLHRAKSYIDEIVNYGKQAEGLSGKAQSILKTFRHNIDAVLDSKFPVYNKVNTVYTDTIGELNKLGATLGRKFRLGDTFSDAQAGLVMRRILSNTQSRSEVLKLLDSMQTVAKKYGIKMDEDIITQANFADVLETMFKSEAPGSFLGQVEKGLESFGSSSGFGGVQQVGSAASELARGNIIRGTIKAGGYAIDVLRGVNQENKIKALRALLKAGNKISNFGGK